MSKSPYQSEVEKGLESFKRGRDKAKGELAKSGLTKKEEALWKRHLELMERSIAEAEDMLASVV
jgi:hypothetical protein